MNYVNSVDSMRSDLAVEDARAQAKYWKEKFYMLCYGGDIAAMSERVLHERREAMLLRKLRWANVRTFFAIVALIASVALWL